MNKAIFWFSILLSGACFGWGDLGHQAVGEIAERNLTPRAKAMVFEILGAEPLAVASFFADQVRADKRFAAFANYHFFEVPQGSDPAQVAQANATKKSADTIICEAPKAISRKDLPREQKAVLLKYLVHVVGDIHQPLHIGNGVDMGANLCSVKWIDPASGETRNTNLHTVWDETLLDWEREDFKKQSALTPGAKRYFGYPEVAEMALKELNKAVASEGLNLESITQVDPYRWYQESAALHPEVYPDKKPVSKPEERVYCKRMDPVNPGKVIPGAFAASKIPTLNEAYARKALRLAKKQMALGGLRLARLLNELAEKTAPSQTSPSAFEDVLEAVQLEKQLVK